MRLAMIGLGRMGAGMARRLLQGGHEVVGYDRNPAISAELERETQNLKVDQNSKEFLAAKDLEELVTLASVPGQPRVIWVMVPSGEPTKDTLEILEMLLDKGDIVIDGGNSNYKDSMSCAAKLGAKGIAMLDCGTSGGIWGLENGYCLMVGGENEAFEKAQPIFATLAQAEGLRHVGPSGAGHFAKMIHNGIEYGMMQAIAEGFELLNASPFGFNLAEVAGLWGHGSVVRSWLLELTERAFRTEARLESVRDYVEDSGEGRWTVLTAMEYNVPAPVITHSLLARFASRQDSSFSAKVVAALRREFGGHAIQNSRHSNSTQTTATPAPKTTAQ